MRPTERGAFSENLNRPRRERESPAPRQWVPGKEESECWIPLRGSIPQVFLTTSHSASSAANHLSRVRNRADRSNDFALGLVVSPSMRPSVGQRVAAWGQRGTSPQKNPHQRPRQRILTTTLIGPTTRTLFCENNNRLRSTEINMRGLLSARSAAGTRMKTPSSSSPARISALSLISFAMLSAFGHFRQEGENEAPPRQWPKSAVTRHAIGQQVHRYQSI
jgi:hypothetical protein